MAVSFRKEAAKYGLHVDHYYSLVGIKNNKVEVYNPHGKTIVIPENMFFNYLLDVEISYFKNQIVGMPKVETMKEFTETWPKLKSTEHPSYIYFDLMVEENNTDVLINLLEMHYPYAYRIIFIIPIDSNNNINENKKMLSSIYPELHRSDLSLGISLPRGKYRIVLLLCARSCKDMEDYLKNGGDKILLRLAASKNCTLKQPVEKKRKEISEKLESYLMDNILKLIN